MVDTLEKVDKGNPGFKAGVSDNKTEEIYTQITISSDQHRSSVREQYKSDHKNGIDSAGFQFCGFQNFYSQQPKTCAEEQSQAHFFHYEKGNIFSVSGHPVQDNDCQHIGKWIVASAFNFQKRGRALFEIQLFGAENRKYGSRVRRTQDSSCKKSFQKNPYMAEIYPQEESRTALEVFQVAEGTGEFFDLSVKPIFRDTFVLGGSAEKEDGSAAGEAGQTRQGREKAPGNATGSRADISLRTGVTDAVSAAADVPRNVSICLQNRLSFSRSTACTAETAWRSVRLERWREDKKKRMKYREKRRTADFIHELIHDPVHIGGEYVGKMAFRAVERLVPGDHILNIALCKGTGRDVGGWYLVLKFRVRLAQ